MRYIIKGKLEDKENEIGSLKDDINSMREDMNNIFEVLKIAKRNNGKTGERQNDAGLKKGTSRSVKTMKIIER